MQKRALAFGVSLIATCLFTRTSDATPRHDFCADVGDTFGWGVSSYSQAGDWPVAAHTMFGVDWRYSYIYVVPTSDPPDAVTSFWLMKADVAHSMGAMPVYTFYELLAIGSRAGVTGATEADIVRQVLANPSLMNQYFANFVMLLQTVATVAPPVLVHVEPDSWGFMMWSMGLDGNTDPTSIPVQVAGSGRAELAGFPDNASGFAHALLALRDMYAPNVRMGWHASNFRQGTRPEVVATFFRGMGDWDVIVTEHPHNEADDATWWLPWDPTRLATNVNWFTTVSSSAHLPIVIWQAPIGTTDWHLLGNANDLTFLTQYANAGVVGVMFELLDTVSNVDDFRASGMFGALGTVPPASSGADGTAGAMRTRLIAYGPAPLAWPSGSICAQTLAVDAGVDASMSRDADGNDAHDGGLDAGVGTTPSGCGCRAAGTRARGAGAWLIVFAIGAWRRRRAMERDQFGRIG